ncbi:MAG: penicillin amidase [Planctomycetota bacterium]|jgi:penicillin amidase
MISIFRWLVRLVAALLAVGFACILLAYYFAAKSVPDYDNKHAVSGLVDRVEIVRDRYGVPHIFGKSDADVFYGLGFTHAQDRLWQMTMLRRTAQGRLSELFGRQTLKTDDFLRRLDLHNLAAASLPFQSQQTRDALDAYAAGVNGWLSVVNSQPLGRGAPEFFVFDKAIDPWQPADSLAISRLMGLRVTGHLEAEVLRLRTALRIPPERLNDVLPISPDGGQIALEDLAQVLPQAGSSIQTAQNSTDQMRFFPVQPRALSGASNAFAVSPSKTTGTGSLLANDPHLPFSAPSIWMLARIELESGGVIGGTIPGLPSVLVGRNQHIAWGQTTTYLDDQDVKIEQINPENPDEYRTPNGYDLFRTKEVLIGIKDEKPSPVELRWTSNGPVIPGSFFNLAEITKTGHVTTLTWNILDKVDRSMTAAIDLMTADTVTNALHAMRNYKAPVQNLTIVDKDSIAFQVIGAMPKRRPDHQTKGRMPAPGWLPKNRWQGYFPYSENPRLVNPSSGILANTNNKIVDQAFPRHISFDWGDTQRIERAKVKLFEREVHTKDSLTEAQLDIVSYTARSLLPLVAGDLWYSGTPAPNGSFERQHQDALGLLADWNGEMSEHSPEPLIYAAWMRALQHRLIRDELGDMVDEFTHADPIFIERVFRDVDGASAWCDVVQSTRSENCKDIASLALSDALLRLNEDYETRMAGWRWGNAHLAAQDHEVLGEIPLLNWFVNIRQSTSGGDNTLMRGKTSGQEPTPFLNVHGAGYRGIYDMGDPDSSKFIISTGQSGHFLSEHYDDLGQLWRRGGFIPMVLDPELARAGASGTTTLIPIMEN